MIVIFGSADNPHTRELSEKICLHGENALVISTDKTSLLETYVSLTVRNNKNSLIINQKDISCNIDEVSSAFVWQPIFQFFSSAKNNFSQDEKFWFFSWRDTLNGIYALLANKNVVINGSVINTLNNQNKLMYHCSLMGLSVRFPEFFIGNNKKDILNFLLWHKTCIIKTLHQMQLVVHDEPTMFLAKRVNAEDFMDFGTEGECPIFIQKFIEKIYDVRVTVIGDNFIACKIDASKSEYGKVDWRVYDMAHTPHSKFALPGKIKNDIQIIKKKLSMEYMTIDFCIDARGDFWILDINPFGKYLWIEDAIGEPITELLAKYLINRRRAEASL